jgi:hypothetical protein
MNLVVILGNQLFEPQNLKGTLEHFRHCRPKTSRAAGRSSMSIALYAKETL